MTEKMTEDSWKKFCDPQKNPEIFAYLQASGKNFEETRAEFNRRAANEQTIARVNLGLYMVGMCNVLVALTINPWNALVAFSCFLMGTSLSNSRGNTKKALAKKAQHYKETGSYRPY